MPIRAPVVKARAGQKFIFSKKERHRKASSQGNSVAVRNSAAGKASLKVSSLGNSVAGGNSAAGKSVFEKRLRWVIRWRGEMRLRQKRLPKASSLGNSVAGGNSAAGKASSPDHINVSSKKVFGGSRKSATRNACTMLQYIGRALSCKLSTSLYVEACPRIFQVCLIPCPVCSTPPNQSNQSNQALPDIKARC